MIDSTVRDMRLFLKQHVFYDVRCQIEKEFKKRSKLADKIYQLSENSICDDYSEVLELYCQWHTVSAELAKAIQEVDDCEIIIKTGYGYVWGSPQSDWLNPMILQAIAKVIT